MVNGDGLTRRQTSFNRKRRTRQEWLCVVRRWWLRWVCGRDGRGAWVLLPRSLRRVPGSGEQTIRCLLKLEIEIEQVAQDKCTHYGARESKQCRHRRPARTLNGRRTGDRRHSVSAGPVVQVGARQEVASTRVRECLDNGKIEGAFRSRGASVAPASELTAGELGRRAEEHCIRTRSSWM
jgi:hypothetical protein